MYSIEFKFFIDKTRRLSIHEDSLKFIMNDVSCELKPTDHDRLDKAINFKVICKEINTIEQANQLGNKISSWLLKFGYETHTLITYPEDNFKISKNGVIETKLRIKAEIDYYVMQNNDQEVLLHCLEQIDFTNDHIYEIYNNVLGLSSEELRLIYLMSILETVVSKHKKIPKKENKRFISAINKLKKIVKDEDIDKDTLDYLNEKLERNKELSIRKKLIHLANILKLEGVFCDLRLKDFLQKCYSIRSNLAHSGVIKIPKELNNYKLQNINGELNRVVWHSIKEIIK